MRSSAPSHRRPMWIGAAVVIVGVAVVTMALASLGGPGTKNTVISTKAGPAHAIGQAAIVPLTTTTTASPTSLTTSAPAGTPLLARPGSVVTPSAGAAASAAHQITAAPATTFPAPDTTTTVTPPTAPATTVPATTTTAVPTTATVALANNFPETVQLTVGGQTYTLAANQGFGPFKLTPAASGNDVIEVRVLANPGCGYGDAGGYFTAGKWYSVQVTTSTFSCTGASATGPTFRVAETLAITG